MGGWQRGGGGRERDVFFGAGFQFLMLDHGIRGSFSIGSAVVT